MYALTSMDINNPTVNNQFHIRINNITKIHVLANFPRTSIPVSMLNITITWYLVMTTFIFSKKGINLSYFFLIFF